MILLDMHLGDDDNGFDILLKLRNAKITVPVLITSCFWSGLAFKYIIAHDELRRWKSKSITNKLTIYHTSFRLLLLCLLQHLDELGSGTETNLPRNLDSGTRCQLHRAIVLKGKVVSMLNQAPRSENMWGSGSIDPRILNHGTRWKQVVSFSHRPLCSPGRSPKYPLNWAMYGPHRRSGRFREENLLHVPEIEPRFLIIL